MNVTIDHPTDRPNFSMVSLDGLTLWFSYSTVIAFQADGRVVASENVWGPTTGKHLNATGVDKSARLPRQEFLDALRAIEVWRA